MRPRIVNQKMGEIIELRKSGGMFIMSIWFWLPASEPSGGGEKDTDVKNAEGEKDVVMRNACKMGFKLTRRRR